MLHVKLPLRFLWFDLIDLNTWDISLSKLLDFGGYLVRFCLMTIQCSLLLLFMCDSSMIASYNLVLFSLKLYLTFAYVDMIEAILCFV